MSVIYSLLEVVTPDVALPDMLDVGWSGEVKQTGGKKQILRYGADRSRRRVVSLGDDYHFFITLSWSVLTPEIKNKILEFYFNKANQMVNSFVWRGYDENNKTGYKDYVVYFDTDLSVGIGQNMDSINDVTLSIKGKLSA
ncbi:MAG: hypothetical protein GY760_14250 [Deltaproteobacteria bacterium]|nr:hypothetical protein [Deltaproteobacteria bacterium]